MKKTITSIIVDSNINQNKDLYDLLNQCSGISVVATAYSISKAVAEIRAHKPDLVFLEIEMDSNGEIEKGLDLFEKLQEDKITFKVIFLARFSQEYNFDGFNFHALDFLSKTSYSIVRLQQSIDRYNAQIQLDQFINPAQKKTNRRIALNTIGGIIQIVKIMDIIYAKADDVYTGYYTPEKNKPTMILKNLKQFEELLDDKSFLRISRFYLVNLNHIISFSKPEQEITMTNGEKIGLGKDGKEPLLDYFNSLT